MEVSGGSVGCNSRTITLIPLSVWAVQIYNSSRCRENPDAHAEACLQIDQWLLTKGDLLNSFTLLEVRASMGGDTASE
jgi:hypothetical protein